MTLRWITGGGDITSLHATYGISRSRCYQLLTLGHQKLLQTLRRHPLAQVLWPAADQIKEYALQILNKGKRFFGQQSFKTRWPRFLRCIPFAWVDGSVFSIPKPYHFLKQARWYSGKHKLHCCNNIFVFAPDGLIIYYKINSPGSFHDLKVSSVLINDCLKDPTMTPRGYGIFGDVGFRKASIQRNILTILKQNDSFWKRTDNMRERAWEKRTEKWIFTHRMAVEWAFAGLKATFRRLSATLPANSTKRAELLELCVLLHNYRLRSSPSYCNQIRSVYEQNKKDDADGEAF